MSNYSKKQKKIKLTLLTINFVLFILLIYIAFNPSILLNNPWLTILLLLYGIGSLTYSSLDQIVNNWGSLDRYSMGEVGEMIVNNELNKLKHTQSFPNIKLPNFKSDIDHIVLSRKGIFVIETKNFTGRIQVKKDKWYQTRKNFLFLKYFKKSLFKSPSDQAFINSMRLRKYLFPLIPDVFKEKLFIHPVVILVNQFDPKDINSDRKIISIDQIQDEFYGGTYTVDKELLMIIYKTLKDLNKWNL